MRKTLLLGVVLLLTAALSYGTSSHAGSLFKAPAAITHAYKASEQSNPYKFGDYLIVIAKTTNVHKDAGQDSKVVQTLRKNGLLKFISSHGNWHKVVVPGSDKIGFVYSKNVK